MPTADIHNIIDQLAAMNYQGNIGFHRLSESSLDPRLFDIVSYAVNKGIKVHEFTNGDYFRNNLEQCQAFDGLFEQLTIGCYDCKTLEALEEEKKFWRAQFSKTRLKFSAAQFEPQVRFKSLVFKRNPVAETYIDQPCFRIKDFRKLLVRYDGNVSLCCEDDECHFDLGNVLEKGVEAVWWSEKNISIKEELLKPGGRKPYPLCQGCMLAPIQKKNFISKLLDRFGR